MVYAFSRKHIAAGLLALLCGGLAQAQVYSWIDPATGKKIYSDQPPPPNVKNATSKDYKPNVVSTSELPFSVQDAVKRNPVTLYANACDICKQGQQLLEKRGIPHSRKNPESDAAASAELKKRIGSQEVPVLLVGEKVLKGFDEASWNAALDAAGYPRTSMKGLPGTQPKDSTPAANPVTGKPAASGAKPGSSSPGSGSTGGNPAPAGTGQGSGQGVPYKPGMSTSPVPIPPKPEPGQPQ